MPSERLPLDGLTAMDLHAALERRRRAQKRLRRAQIEAERAEWEVQMLERKLGLNQHVAYIGKPEPEIQVRWK